jgi:predicted transcriptional regulator
VRFLKVLDRVTSKIAPGRTPSFTEAHVLKALETIGKHRFVGRIRLSKELGSGEGTTRTLVKHLKREKLVEVSRKGIVLSESGKELLSKFRSYISEGVEIPPGALTVGPHNFAVLVRNRGHAVKYGLEQRDAAIRAGASGATTLVFSQNKLTMPGVKEDVFKEVSLIRNILMSKLRPRENDVIIIGSAEEKKRAESGAKMSALELLKPTDVTT